MSRVDKCIDNDPIEGFWDIIKAEMYYLNEFHTTEESKTSIDKYITLYNNERQQGRYRDQTPNEVRATELATVDEIEQYPIQENKHIKKYYHSFKKAHKYRDSIEKDDLSYDKSSTTNFNLLHLST